MQNKALTIHSVTFLALLIWAGAGFQGALGADDTRFIRYQGTVTEVSSGYFVASTRRIELMDVSSGGKRYTTEIHDTKGKLIEPSAVRKGDVFWVIGQVLPNGNILANKIYLQIHE